MVDLAKLNTYYLKHLITAGEYACCIQGNVSVHEAKEDQDSIFGQALTDADLSVQNYIEIITLARYPQFAFYGEEDERSLNKKYFLDGAEYILSVDPINGTRFYMDKVPLFDIILTLTQGKELIWALSYMPKKEIAYYAMKGGGAWQIRKNEFLAGGEAKKLNVQPGPGTILTFRAQHIVDALSAKLNISDTDLTYDPGKPVISINGIFQGEISGFAIQYAHIIDWLAYAFIVGEAGAFATDFSGRPLPNAYDYPRCRVPSMIVASTKEIHQTMMECLKSLPL